MTSIDLEVVSGSSSAKRVLVTGATGFIVLELRKDGAFTA